MDWKEDYHRKSFIESSIYFSSNLKFNDCFDLKLPVKFTGKLKFDATSFINQIREDVGIEPSNTEIQMANHNWDHVIQAEPDIIEQNRIEYAKLIEKFEVDLGVFCLSKNYKSPIMWGQYASSYKGFCIGFDKDELKNYFKKFGRRFEFYDVEYVDEFPTVDLSMADNTDYLSSMANRRFAAKYIEWKYEDEIRIIGSDYNNKLLKIPASIVNEIIVGYKMDKHDVSAIQILGKEIYPSAKFLMAKPSTESFEMELIEINNMHDHNDVV